MSNDYYQILGVDKSASDKEIREAYRALARRMQDETQPFTPDQIDQINHAYQVLGDPDDRAKYDTSMLESASAPSTASSSIKHNRGKRAPGWLINFLILVVGVAIGFFGRPIVIPYPPDPQAAMMQTVLSTTRHFKGNDNAPVTIIEFADFQ